MTKKRICIIALAVLLLVLILAAAGKAAASPWTLTQHYGGSEIAMFYSLSRNDRLILIDGGYQANAEYIRSVIEENGGYVDCWFLTHYHDDHCDAFNALWPEYQDRIGTVYVTPLTWEAFEPYCRDWDSPHTFRTFLEQTEGNGKIVPLQRGEELRLDGLKVSVFNAWDDEILQYTNDVANNCSLVFKIETGKTSVLFLGDLSSGELADRILEQFGTEKMKADYIQAGHHGWAPSLIPFYKALQPKEMFLDAGEYYLTSEEYADAHGVLVRWCEENGIPIHDYRGVPYSLIMR